MLEKVFLIYLKQYGLIFLVDGAFVNSTVRWRREFTQLFVFFDQNTIF